MQNKRDVLPVIILVMVAICVSCFAYWANNRILDVIEAQNREKSSEFLEALYFVSNEVELKLVQQQIDENRLRGGVAVFLSFYKNGGYGSEIDRVVQFIQSTHYLPVFVYDGSEFYDFDTADKLLGRKIRGCKPMGCAYVLRLGKRTDDCVFGCTTTGKKSDTQEGAKKLVRFGLKSLRNFAKK